MAEFKQQVVAAIAKYLPHLRFSFEERRGVELRCRVEVDDHTLIDVYHSAVTSKTSYALVKGGGRIFGYDNFRGWHVHPYTNPDAHLACQEPTPDQVFREIKEILTQE
jgi:hypothetical protein